MDSFNIVYILSQQDVWNKNFFYTLVVMVSNKPGTIWKSLCVLQWTTAWHTSLMFTEYFANIKFYPPKGPHAGL